MADPTPNPPPIVVTHNVDWISRVLSGIAIGLVLQMAWSKPNPPLNPPVTPPVPPVADMTTIGQSYVISGMAKPWADGMDHAGTVIEGTGSMADAKKAYESDLQSGMKSSFGTIVQPSLEAALPSGSSLTPANRPIIGKAFHDLANGARKVK